jgi:DNA-binding NarL/FixJ family response regulator
VNRARILLADDHKEMRDRVRRHLEREFEVLEAVENGRALLEAASELQPDVCLLDISMPVMNGIDTARKLKDSGSTAKIVFLTIHEDLDFVQAALKTGASGYVIKRRMASDLRIAIKEALAGRTFISTSIVFSAEPESHEHERGR